MIWIKVYIMQADVRTEQHMMQSAQRIEPEHWCTGQVEAKKDEDTELFVKMVKRLARGFGFKLCDRIKFEDSETGKKYV